MGEVINTVKETGKTITTETVKFGGRIIIGVGRGVMYLFGKPLPNE